MSHLFERLQIPPQLHHQYQVLGENGTTSHTISGLSQINFIVGCNNAGKSRLIRHIFQVEFQRFLPRDFPNEILEVVKFLKEGVARIGSPNIVIHPFQPSIEALSTFDLITEGNTNFKPLVDVIEQAKAARWADISVSSPNGYPSPTEFERPIQKIGTDAAEKLGDSMSRVLEEYRYERLYIPTLRGLRPFDKIDKDIYAERTKQDYFRGKPQGSIFTGLTFYQDLKNLLLGQRSERAIAKAFEDFLSKELYQGEEVTLIPMKNSDVVHIRIGREKELPVHALGDGVQHLIILTFPLFRDRHKKTLVFIEEPELFLHPGMQRSLLRALRKFTEHQYFVVTHSNHLLDMSVEFDDVSIYTLSKEVPSSNADEADAHFVVEGVSTHDQRILALLGARVSSVFLSNCTIWVEGITDRRYLAHYLELYNLHLLKTKVDGEKTIFLPKQDLHYSFVEYAGGNITHWSFLDSISDPIEVERLCAKLMLVADRDNSSAKDARHQKLSEKLGERFYRLDCREIENLLEPDVLKRVLEEYGEEIACAESFTRCDYKDAALGEFLEGKFNIKRKGGYAAESGTLKDKLNFCEKALAHLDSFDNLSNEAKAITLKMYEFIKENNR